MSLEERLEKAEKLVAEVKAELATMRATKPRNWPERIEAGMCFGSEFTTTMWMATDKEDLFVCLRGETDSGKAIGFTIRSNMDDFNYLGRARDILTIRTDAHEPTGAELVGKVCEFSDRLTGPWSPGECAAFGQNSSYPYRKAGGAEWKYARLAK